MTDLLHMELRHLFKSRNFYIITGVTLLLVVLLIGLVAFVTSPDIVEDMQQGDNASVTVEGDPDDMRAELNAMSQLDFSHECLSSGFLLFMIGIGATLLLCGDFTSGYIKNICFTHSRTKYVLASVLTIGVYSAVLAAAGVLVSEACPYLFGLRMQASRLLPFLQYTLMRWLPLWAFGLMALALSLLTRSVPLGVAIAIVSGSGFTATLVNYICQKLRWPLLGQYMLSNVESELCVPGANAQQVGLALACCLGWGVFYSLIGLLAMEKRDI